MIFEVGKLYVLFFDNSVFKNDSSLYKTLLEKQQNLLSYFPNSKILAIVKILPFLYLDETTSNPDYFYDGVPFLVMDYNDIEKQILILQTNDGESKIGYLQFVPAENKADYRENILYQLE